MLSIFPIGGIGNVTKNMYVYELGDDMLIVDCGIGFPDETMPGVELLVPDTQYIQDRLQQGAKLHGIVLTHGHDDHIAALPYVYNEIGADKVDIWGSPLTAEFAMARLADKGIEREVKVYPEEPIQLGPFSVEAVKVTHSIPDTRHLVIRTPEGLIYHGSDFKIDLTPIDGQRTDLQKIANIGEEGILCAMLDCLRIERHDPTPSEAVIGPAIRREMYGVKGKVLVTLMSSNLHRIQQVIDICEEFGRKLTFIGRSVEQNVNIAMNMGILKFPPNMKVNKKNLAEVPDDQLCIVIAGSQGQTGSSLVRAVSGEHRMVSLNKGDKVIFASEPIPGSESAVYGTIDAISEQGVEVAYSDVADGLHVSGHAGEYEQMLLVHLLRAKYLFPIGGEERHRVQFGLKVQAHGYKPQQVVLPHYGKFVEFQNGEMKYGGQVNLRERTITVEGSTVGVIDEDLEDRTKLGTQGMVVAVVNKVGNNYDVNEIFLEERGLGLGSEERQAEFHDQVKFTIQDVVKNFEGNEQALATTLEKAIFGVLRREFNRTPVVMAIINVV